MRKTILYSKVAYINFKIYYYTYKKFLIWTMIVKMSDIPRRLNEDLN